MIIPKQYGGLQLGRYAQSSVLIRSAPEHHAGVNRRRPQLAGPAELLVHYGTEAQKTALPAEARTRRGNSLLRADEPDAGSDAAAISDTGIVCRGTYAVRRCWA